MNLFKILIIALGGAIGSVARYLTVKGVDQKMNAFFPYGTLTVNLVGSFLIGLFYVLALRKTGMNENWRLFLGAGFCGGFTTFSAFAWENFSLFQQKMLGTAFLYTSVSLVAGFSALALGAWIARFI
ncbi:MAG TPA: fluoride efflux transporter CrcB [Chryseolinea sp.]